MNVARGYASGIRKAAIVLVSLDSETAASVLKHMKDDDIEQLTLEIATLGKVTLPSRRMLWKSSTSLPSLRST